MSWFLKTLTQHYVDFKGRARRKEYWYFGLFSTLIYLGVIVLDAVLLESNPEEEVGILTLIYFLLFLLPSISVSVRRLHDIGYSGWWCLLILLPIMGMLILWLLALFDSQEHTNEYGPSPKYG